MRLACLVLTALLAFAANSVLCRLALEDGSIDPASFATLRVLSGTLTVLLICWLRAGRRAPKLSGDWPSALALFAYMAGFSFAYVSLATGTGALILFGTVQLTMLLQAIRQGERPPPTEWFGLTLALAGLAYLMLPGVEAPAPIGSLLMVAAGVGWGLYSLRGRGASFPLAVTAGNFARCLPLLLLLSLVNANARSLSSTGCLLACSSGALASGVGYAVWYAALPSLSASRAAIVQLAVPIIAALAGIAILDEELTTRFVLAMALVLGGVGLALAKRRVR